LSHNMKLSEIEIDAKALKNNYDYISTLNENSEITCVVKANAYGHGLIHIVGLLLELGASSFAVARVDEAKVIRDLYSSCRIIVLQGYFSKGDLEWCSEHDVDVVLHCNEQLNIFLDTKLVRKLNVWLKINLGMNRLGIDIEQIEYFHRKLLENSESIKSLSYIGHFSDSDLGIAGNLEREINLFNLATSSFKGTKSLYNSAAVLVPIKNFNLDFVRAGIALYGVSPFSELKNNKKLNPVMTLKSKIISIRKISEGDKVSYHGKWNSLEDTNIAVVSIGYGDGYPRNISSDAYVLLNNRYVPIVGNVCMDMLMINLGASTQDRVGDVVILWGKGLPIEKVSQFSGHLSYELLTRITERVNRVIIT